MLRHDGAHTSAFGLKAARRAHLMHGAAALQDSAGHGRCRTRRIGGAVGWREGAAFPGAASRRAALCCVGGAEHMGDDASRFREIAPARPALEFAVVVAQIEQAATGETGVLAAFRAEGVPEGEAFG